MARGDEYSDDSSFLTRVFWGQNHAVSVRAIVFATTLFVVVAIFQYASMASIEDVVYFDIGPALYRSAMWREFVEAFRHPGLLFGLAALHAYLNEGYIPAILLATAPAMGTLIWIFSGPPPAGPYVLTWKPFLGYWEWVTRLVRLVVPYATLGFLVGLVVRWVRTDVLDLSEPV